MAYQYHRIKWEPGMFEDPGPCNGYVNEHREMSAQKLGRTLKSGEVVHHVDEDKFNNDPENLMVFRTAKDHASYHSQINNNYEPILLINEDGSYSTIAIYDKNIICECGLKKDQTADKCIECHKKIQAKNIPPKEELKEIIWELPMTQIGLKYNVSDKAVSKWIKKYDLEKPPIGYWAKTKS